MAELTGDSIDIDDEIDGAEVVEEGDDGTATVRLADDEDSVEINPDFWENLAPYIDAAQLDAYAVQMADNIKHDAEAREKRDKQYEEGLKRTGLGGDAPGGADFDGASRVVHPMLVEATVDFSSKAMKEIFPSKGPVKQHIPGDVTSEKIARARRKARHMNWQMVFQMKELRAEVEQMFTQLPLAGVGYLKLGWDFSYERPCALFIPVDEMLIPYAASSFYTAERRTHRYGITADTYRTRVEAGVYMDVDLIESPQEPQPTKAQAANDKIEGKEQSSYNEDGLRIVCDTEAKWDFGLPEGRAPYIVSLDETTGKVMAVYRNFMPSDAKREPLLWTVEFPFVPWRGAYPVGLTHMIGSLSGGATGALRALLDSAHINNQPGGLKLKGGSRGGQNLRPRPTQITEIEGGGAIDDIRNVFMPYPFKEPSAVLFQLLGFLVDAGKGVVRTTFEDLPDSAGPNMPVGTALALIEQGGTVFQAIHARLHAAMQRTLEVLHRINDMYLDEGDLVDDTGELLAFRRDYASPVDVVPVSDPNIFSETQRYAQTQAVVARSDAKPELYDQLAVEKEFLERLKIPNPEKLLRKQPTPEPMNAVNENVAAALGRPVMAFPEQDHLAHIQVHVAFLKSPSFGMSDLIAPGFLPAILAHLKEHIVLWYAQAVYAVLKRANRGADPVEMMDKDDPKVAAGFDKLLAVASDIVVAGAEQAVFANLPPIIAEAMQLVQKFQPAMPPDPTQAVVAAQMAETKRKAEADQLKAQTEAMKEEHEDAREAADIQARERINTDDNRTALTIAAARVRQPAMNANPNPTPNLH